MIRSTDELLNQILSEAPSPETLVLLLKRSKAEGQITTVIQECIKALCRFPRDIRIRGLLAEACFESGWLSRAEMEVETVTAQIEDLVHLYKLRAQIYSGMNRRQEAVKSLEIYLAHRPDDEESRALLQELSPTPRLPAVESSTENLQESLPLVPEIATPTLAEVYFAQGQIQEAISTYEKVLAQKPEAEQWRTRMEELRAMLAPPPAVQQEDRGAEGLRSRKMRLINVLERWKESIAGKNGVLQ